MKLENGNQKSKIVIVGAGPSGASLAIILAKMDFDVFLIEREKFPRHKLCGEFISPECLHHFRQLGVFDRMRSRGGEKIERTVFYAMNGKSVSVASRWFNAEAQNALSLSRAEMDFQLLEKARAVGVEVLEETQAVGLLFENEAVCGVKVKLKDGSTKEIAASLTIDATGRANVLGKLAEKEILRQENSPLKAQNLKSINKRLVGFKTHLENAAVEKGTCEIYFFRGGYGGLSFVENNLANHCFLIDADTVKRSGGDADKIVREVVFQNCRAAETLRSAKPVFDWLAVSVDGFGAKKLSAARNLFSVGDAAAFIDPFTGSGMLMALESAEILSSVIAEKNLSFEQRREKYEVSHHEKFQNRLRLCSVMRKLAFMPKLTEIAVSFFGLNESALRFLARSTRNFGWAMKTADKNTKNF